MVLHKSHKVSAWGYNQPTNQPAHRNKSFRRGKEVEEEDDLWSMGQRNKALSLNLYWFEPLFLFFYTGLTEYELQRESPNKVKSIISNVKTNKTPKEDRCEVPTRTRTHTLILMHSRVLQVPRQTTEISAVSRPCLNHIPGQRVREEKETGLILSSSMFC